MRSSPKNDYNEMNVMRNITLEVLTSPGCAHCSEFLAFWNTESASWPNVLFREFSLLTTEGQLLARRHRVLVSPGILVNDELFATGPVDKERFKERLKGLSEG